MTSFASSEQKIEESLLEIYSIKLKIAVQISGTYSSEKKIGHQI
jgi:hypothetical protein